METIQIRVKKMIGDKLGIPEVDIKEESSFKTDLHTDSLDLYEIFCVAEKEYGISIRDEEAEKIMSVGQLIDCIKSQTN